ncbi:SCO family protein [Alcaligenaceae bacterium]|nr:SCO family protein [Alcaligenaceae bacterium]
MSVLRTLLASLVLLGAGGAIIAGLTDGFQAFTTETARRVKVRAAPQLMPAVALETDSGKRINLADLRGKWLVVDFIYTRCVSYCLALGSEFAQLQDSLAGALASGTLQLLSISFDPQHDTPSQLAGYLQRSGSRGSGWLAARPLNNNDLNRLKQAFGIVVIADEFGGYEHNAAIQLVDPQGRLVEIVDPDDQARVVQVISRGMAQ